jgi:hypothetical protein
MVILQYSRRVASSAAEKESNVWTAYRDLTNHNSRPHQASVRFGSEAVGKIQHLGDKSIGIVAILAVWGNAVLPRNRTLWWASTSDNLSSGSDTRNRNVFRSWSP